MKIWILLAVLATLVFGGCIMPLPAMACEKPYMKAVNECCLDSNNNGVCDRDECSTTPQNKTLEESVSICKAMKTNDIDNCFIRLALENNNAAVCSEIYDSDQKDSCLTQLAIKYHNVGYCSMVSIDAMAREDCVKAVNGTIYYP